MPIRANSLMMALAVCVGCPAVFVPPAEAGETSFAIAELTFNASTAPTASADYDFFFGGSFNERFSFGGIAGRPDQVIIPEVSLLGATIIPEVRADTRTGLRVSGDVFATAGIDLSGSVSSGGIDAGSRIAFDTSIVLPDQIRPGRFFSAEGRAEVVSTANLNVQLPTFSASARPVLDVGLDARLEYGLFPVVPYDIAPFGFNFSLPDFELFSLDFNLNLPDLPSVSLPGFNIPTVDLPQDPSDTLIDIQLPPPPSNASFGSLQLVNPSNFQTQTGVVDGGASFSTRGEIARLTADIDGIASFAATGVSFTGLEVPIRVGGNTVAKVGYDLIDVQYGPQIGLAYEGTVNPFLTADITFDRDVVVEIDGTPTVTNSILGVSWEDLPRIATLGDETVNATVNFTALEAVLSQSADLVVSDYLSIKLLEAFASIRGLPRLTTPPILRTSFSPLADAFGPININVLDQENVSVASLALPPELLNTVFSFQIDPIDIPPAVVFNGINDPALLPTLNSEWRVLETGAIPNDLRDFTLIIGDGPVGTPVALLTPMDAVDTGSVIDTQAVERFSEIRLRAIPGLGIVVPVTFDVQVVTVTQGQDLAPVEAGALQIIPGSSYTIPEGFTRAFDLPELINDGTLTSESSIVLQASGGSLRLLGDGVTRLESAATIDAALFTNGAGHTLELVDEDSFSSTFTVTEQETAIPRGGTLPTETSSQILLSETFSQNGFEFTGITSFDNAGTIRIENADLEAAPTLLLRNSGVIEGSRGARIEFEPGPGVVLENTGVIRVFDDAQFELPGHDFTILGVTSGEGIGVITAADGGIIDFDFGSRVDFTGAQRLHIEDGGLLAADSSPIVFTSTPGLRPSEVVIDEGGTAVFGGVTVKGEADQLVEFNNAGTLIFFQGRNDLRPVADTTNQDPNNPDPPTDIISPTALTNTGTVIVESGASLHFDAIITEFTGNGTTLSGGRWELRGADRAFDNLASDPGAPDVALVDLAITEIDPATLNVPAPENADVFERSTRFSTNAADLILSGAASWAYLNTLDRNLGSLTLENQHTFNTEGSLTNSGEILVTSGSHLNVNGQLLLTPGALVDLSSGGDLSWVTADVEQVFIDPETDEVTTTTVRRGIEVVGATLRTGAFSELPGIQVVQASFNPSDPTQRDERVVITEGASWLISDAIDGQGNILPGVVALGDESSYVVDIVRNDGEITLAGESASFLALNAIRDNTGFLRITGGNDFTVDNLNSVIESFDNTGTLIVDGGSSFTVDRFTSAGDDALFVLGSQSLLDVASFELLGGAAVIDGVVTVAEDITVSADTALTGAGQIAGSLINEGVLAPGSSPGVLEIFGISPSRAALSTASGSLTQFEIQGFLPGETYDQILVSGGGVELFGGVLQLVLDPTIDLGAFAEWTLIEADREILGAFDEIEVLGIGASEIAVGDAGSQALLDQLLASLGAQQSFLGLFGEHGFVLDRSADSGTDVALTAHRIIPAAPTAVLLVPTLALTGVRTRRTPRTRSVRRSC